MRGGDRPAGSRSRFAEVVDLALYDPERGFYASGGPGRPARRLPHEPGGGPALRRRGGAGARPLVGSSWGSPRCSRSSRPGPGPGTLARSVLAAAPRCAPALRYVLVERSAAPAEHHAEHLAARRAGVRLRQPAGPRRRASRSSPATGGPIVVSLSEPPRVPGPVRRARQRAARQPPVRAPRATAEGPGPRSASVSRTTRLVGDARPDRCVRRGRPPRSAPGSPTSARPADVGARRPAARRARRPGDRPRLRARPPTSSPHRPWTEWVRTYRSHARGGAPARRPRSRRTSPARWPSTSCPSRAARSDPGRLAARPRHRRAGRGGPGDLARARRRSATWRRCGPAAGSRRPRRSSIRPGSAASGVLEWDGV